MDSVRRLETKAKWPSSEARKYDGRRLRIAKPLSQSRATCGQLQQSNRVRIPCRESELVARTASRGLYRLERDCSEPEPYHRSRY